MKETKRIVVTKEMQNAVLGAMKRVLDEKGEGYAKKMTMQSIEFMLMDMGVDFYIPLRTTLGELIEKKQVNYYQLQDGRLIFGFTKVMRELAEKANQPKERKPVVQTGSCSRCGTNVPKRELDEYYNMCFTCYNQDMNLIAQAESEGVS